MPPRPDNAAPMTTSSSTRGSKSSCVTLARVMAPSIGHSTHHHNGAAVGGVLGAMIGTGIASSSNYYGDPYYGGSGNYGGSGYYGAPSYAPAPGYAYAPPPAYYAAPPVGATIVYSSGPRYYHRHRPYYRGHRYY